MKKKIKLHKILTGFKKIQIKDLELKKKKKKKFAFFLIRGFGTRENKKREDSNRRFF